MKTIAFFNPKDGAGTTTLVYHLAWMFNELCVPTLAVDLDPQSTLTVMVLEDERLEELWADGAHPGTILGAVSPTLCGSEDHGPVQVEPVAYNLGLVAGDLGLSGLEPRLAAAWRDCLDRDAAAFRLAAAFHRVIADAAAQREAAVALVDVGPTLGAISRAAIIAADYVVIPLACDLFAPQSLRTLGPALREWRAEWQERLGRRPPEVPLVLPAAEMRPVGYLVVQDAVHYDRHGRVSRKWITRIPGAYHREVLAEAAPPPVDAAADPSCLAVFRHYRSLIGMALEARKPMFFLRAADGAMGAHIYAVNDCYAEFAKLARELAARCGVAMP